MGAICGMRITSTIPYGIALTKIFRYEGILLEDYESTYASTVFLSKNLKQNEVGDETNYRRRGIH